MKCEYHVLVPTDAFHDAMEFCDNCNFDWAWLDEDVLHPTLAETDYVRLLRSLRATLQLQVLDDGAWPADLRLDRGNVFLFHRKRDTERFKLWLKLHG